MDDYRFSDWKLQIVTQRLNAGDNAGNWVQGDICPVLTKAYPLTVIGGTGSGSYPEGASVTISAAISANSLFRSWTGLEGLEITEGAADTADVTFTMPAGALTVTAVFVEAALTVDAMCDFTIDDGEVTEVVKVKVEHLDTVEGLDLSVGAMLIVAQYSDNDDFGKMTNIYTCPVTEDGIYDTEVFIYDEEEFYYYRVFLVDGKTWKPLYESLRRWGAGD